MDSKKNPKEYISGLSCHNDFVCMEHGLEHIFKGLVSGCTLFYKCINEPPESCPSMKKLGAGFTCKCPSRKIIAWKLSQ